MAPTDDDVRFIYLILTINGPPKIDWAAVGDEMDRKPGAVSKRWSRLKQSMETGTAPSVATTYPFVWLCLKHSLKDGKGMDWKTIAESCNTTPGAASKRFSRLKIAMESGAPTPVLVSSASAAPVKTQPSAAVGGKRKRGKSDAQEEVIVKKEPRSKYAESTSTGDSSEYVPTPAAKRAKPAPQRNGRSGSAATRRSTRLSRPLNEDDVGQFVKVEPRSSSPEEGRASLSPTPGEFREPEVQASVEAGELNELEEGEIVEGREHEYFERSPLPTYGNGQTLERTLDANGNETGYYTMRRPRHKSGSVGTVVMDDITAEEVEHYNGSVAADFLNTVV